jgi:HK97 family phage portal protein
MGLLGWFRGDETPHLETRHTDTDPSAYPIEWQLDAVVWHQYHGQVSPERVPAVYAAIDLISASVAQLETVETTPLSRQPDPFDTRFNFFFETVQSLCWHGDAFWLLTPTDRGIDSMQVLDPADVDVEWDDQFRRRLRSYRWKTEEVARSRISHLRFHPRAGQLEGLSPIEAARMTWEGAAYSEEYGSSLFGASGVPSGVLTAPTALSKEEADELKSQWNTARSGGRNTAVLSGGMAYQPVELSPADIGWLETRASNAQEVARIFHIPGDLLEIAIQGGSGSITYKNLAEVGADFVQYCLSPYITIIEQAWAALSGQPALTFDTSPLYRESLETRARTLQMLVAAGVDPDSAAEQTGFTDLPMTSPVQEVAPV